MYRADTIVACATPPGRGAVAIVRLSGPEALAIAGLLFEPSSGGALEPRRLVHGRLADDGRPVDEVLCVYMPGPRSYTGEDTVEFQCHGSPVVVEAVVAAALARGARAAGPGEFTRRAVLNGRMDLVQAEAVADLISATVAAGARQAWEQLQGALSGRLAEIRAAILDVLAEVEANVDFSDEELPEERLEMRADRLGTAESGLAALLEGFAAARRQREGYRVVFCGRPNVGKSSLVNALLGHGRMIVTDEPGTTRDSVEETVDLGGLAFVLTDTAGLRETASVAESAAVERARRLAEDADIRVLVIDRSAPLSDGDRELAGLLDGRSCVLAINKCDLDAAVSREEIAALGSAGACSVMTSAIDGSGCPELADALAGLAKAGDVSVEAEPAVVSRARHRSAIERASACLAEAGRLALESPAHELVALELRAAVGELAGITEVLDNEEILDRIFSEFCIGK